MDWSKNLPSILAWGGAVVTGFFAVLSASLTSRASTKQLSLRLRSENERDRLEARRERLEELYSLVTRYQKEAINYCIPLMTAMDGKATYQQAHAQANADPIQLDSDRLFTLAELYFRGGHEKLDDLRKGMDEALGVMSEFKEFCMDGGTESPEHLSRMVAALRRFDDAVKAYKALLREYASDL